MRVNIFWITFDQDKIESCGFQPMKRGDEDVSNHIRIYNFVLLFLDLQYISLEIISSIELHCAFLFLLSINYMKTKGNLKIIVFRILFEKI
jgi:hypothetical protein